MAIQNSVNQMLGTVAGAIATGTHLANQNKQTKAIEDQTETMNKAQEKWDKINEPDYGQTMLNAEAEAKSIGSLLNSQYPGYKLANVRGSYNAQKKFDVEQLENAHQLALEKWKEAAMAYNYPNGKPMVTTLTGGND